MSPREVLIGASSLLAVGLFGFAASRAIVPEGSDRHEAQEQSEAPGGPPATVVVEADVFPQAEIRTPAEALALLDQGPNVFGPAVVELVDYSLANGSQNMAGLSPTGSQPQEVVEHLRSQVTSINPNTPDGTPPLWEMTSYSTGDTTVYEIAPTDDGAIGDGFRTAIPSK